MQCGKINMDNYQYYLPVRVRIFKSSEQDYHSFGASVNPEDADLNGHTFCNGDSDDVTFFFHTCLVYKFDLGEVGSSFTGSSGSSHSFFGS
jgi:hypothetical protein